jgi:DNA-binding NarL/FixJ family response regulator
MKILLADDHTVFREGIKQILLQIKDIIVEEARNLKESIRKVKEDSFDIVILDISMPDGNGIEIIKELKDINPGLEILILSMHSEEKYAFRSIEAGASGYLTKNCESAELITAIKKIANHEKYITDSVANNLAIGLSGGLTGKTPYPRHSSLSKREFQIMCLIASGNTLTGIAGKLGLSINTISTFRARILKKMHLENNAKITHYAIKEGLVNLD